MVALAILILIGGAMFTALWLRYAGAKAQIDRMIRAQDDREILAATERRKAELNGALVAAHNRRSEILAQASNASQLLTNLLCQAQRAMADALALKTNALGRTVALHPDLVAQARRLYETDLSSLASPAETSSKLESVRRIQAQLSEAFGSPSAPDPSTAVTPQNCALWADQELRRVTHLQNLLAALGREARVKVTTATLTPDSPTLEGAIGQLTQDEAAVRQRLLAATEAETKAQTLKLEAENEARRIRELAQAEADKRLAEATARRDQANAEIAAMHNRANAEIAGLRKKAEADIYLRREQCDQEIKAKQEQWAIEKNKKEEDLRLAKEQAQQEASLILAQARLASTLTQIAITNLNEQAKDAMLRKQATNAEVLALLAPFITPGYWTPRSYTADQRPLSYQMLLGEGALDDSELGWARLAKIAMAVDDKVRPRWKLTGGPLAWDKVPESVQKVKIAQMHLRELSQILVEHALLLP